ncbi:unnamed protein product, partial [Brenthis ino]
MLNECYICKTAVLVTQKRIKCIKCQTQCHLECTNPTSSNKSVLSRGKWICLLCTSTANKGGNNTRTPPSCEETINKEVNNTQILSTPSTSTEGPQYLNKNSDFLLAIRDEVKEAVSRTIGGELSKIREELNGLQNIKVSIDYLSSLFESVKQELEEAKTEIFNLKKENSNLKEIIATNNSTINFLEKESRSSNIELHCVPEFRSENLVKVVEQIGNIIKVPILEGHISKCTRIAKFNKNSSRPRSVLVKFGNQLLRDRFLASVINFNKSNAGNKLNTSHIRISRDKTPIYISENLTAVAKELHGATRIFAKEKGYRFVWTRNGKIFLRKSISSDIIVVKTKDQLKSLE